MRALLEFLDELRDHNDRVWFQQNKERYTETRATFEAFVGALIPRVAAFDPEIAGVTVKESVFRIYRDARYARGGGPYKTHAGAFIARGGRTAPRGGYYLHVEPDNSMLAGGIWCPTPELLQALRRDVYDNIDEFLSIVRDDDFARHYAMDQSDMLRRAPRPFPYNEPAATWTRYKRYTAWRPLPDDFFDAPDALDRCADALKPLYPLNRFLNYTVDELDARLL